ncbi:hypothetical protein CAPTEDRAFT_194796 [Capitella teleta]|uniref:Jacalin-type lectin domain-containing protein n=1 Tax=Capitella teleta TaxID=283909 RepID=R7V0Y5_CAPTE|nr:hypothetical protein CAPTEDRAFT_194796 [Capitella teleta]|eukprot:ELU09361.1 hypothetical protein CAPTEDRAFT_194796 [Capitella teleta]
MLRTSMIVGALAMGMLALTTSITGDNMRQGRTHFTPHLKPRNNLVWRSHVTQSLTQCSLKLLRHKLSYATVKTTTNGQRMCSLLNATRLCDDDLTVDDQIGLLHTVPSQCTTTPVRGFLGTASPTPQIPPLVCFTISLMLGLDIVGTRIEFETPIIKHIKKMQFYSDELVGSIVIILDDDSHHHLAGLSLVGDQFDELVLNSNDVITGVSGGQFICGVVPGVGNLTFTINNNRTFGPIGNAEKCREVNQRGINGTRLTGVSGHAAVRIRVLRFLFDTCL